MAGLFGTSAPIPQAPPGVDDIAVQQKADDEMRRRAMAQGRASTILTDPSTQRDPQLNQQKMALG